MPTWEPIATVLCEITWDTIAIDEAVDIWDWKFVKKEFEATRKRCADCWKVFDESNKERKRVRNWDIVCLQCIDNDYFTCQCCDEFYPNDQKHETHGWDFVCDTCRNEEYFYCHDCGWLFHNDDSHEYNDDYYCYDCIDRARDEDENLETKDGVIITTKSDEKLPKQTPYECPENIHKRLKNFYYDLKPIHKQTLRKRKDIKLSSSIQLQSDLSFSLFNRRKWWLDIDIDREYMEAMKYSKTRAISYDWVKVKYEFIDIMWKRKEREESIMSIREYYKKLLWDKFTTSKPDKADFTKDTFEVELSNDLDHKMKLAEENDDAFHSCQTPENVNNYSKGMRDWFWNGCNIPVAVKSDWKIVGRQLCRLMIDNKWNEFLFLDRLYLNDRYWDSKRKIYVEIAKRLRKHFDLAVPTESRHDKPVANRLYEDMHNEFKEATLSLRQPMRWYNDIRRAYYHDSHTLTYEFKWMIYDKIDKWMHVQIISKQ